MLKDKHARMLRGKMTEVFVDRVLGSKVPLPKRVYVGVRGNLGNGRVGRLS